MITTQYDREGKLWYKSNSDEGWSIAKGTDDKWSVMCFSRSFLDGNADERIGIANFDSLQEAEEVVALWLLKRSQTS